MSAEARRILVLGGAGQLAWELRRSLASLGQVIAAGRRSATHAVDLEHPETILPLVEAVRPDWIVNAAAYTAVDRAEQEPERARAVNGVAPGLLAEAAGRVGAQLVHYSTDYVFDGRAGRPYLEDDPAYPLGVYGASKLDGEAAVARAGCDWLILRTAWLYGARGGNFMRTLRRLARERAELRVVADQVGAPTWARHVAEATAQMLARLGDDRAAWHRHCGVYHLSAAGETTWHGFAEAIVAHQRRHEELPCRAVTAIATADYPTPARRPACSLLDNGKLARAFGIRLPDWRVGLAQVQEELDAGEE
ncbi:dTDP-4-dehydrorhamnose reductase [Parasulfuritortus cantonensis]|uniref:dTDP-4-dehydrorhamnose reductase n=1 Tax=Parasulfuritortus cantonensis TaxID=2528202 RepID=A0A4R1B1N5_9PROT|nr:dTDP-4-dehydrorhamnose reductase [Parasulfuritortus cantonensis]TCJ11711.1 dTDP-4-dehydrorhamnose reductase [Parasulfuritortus cantonensis]